MSTRETTLLESASAEDSFAVIGGVLRAARIDKGFSLDDVAQGLRYSKNYVRYLENGDFDLLPGSTYVAGYLRSYGQFLGIDGTELVARYQALLNPVEMRPKHKFPIPGQRSQRSGAVVASFAVMIAVLGYVGWYWAEKPGLEAVMPQQETAKLNNTVSLASAEPDVLASDDTAATPSTTSDITQSNLADITVQETNAAASDPASSEELPSTAEIAATASDSSAGMPAIEDKIAGDDGTDADSANATSAPAAVEDESSNPGAAVANARDEANDITLRATASSWVEIVRNDGEEVMTKLMRDGDIYIIDGGENLYLSTGNAGGLEFVLRDGSVLSAGDVGEILRDLPLKPNSLIDNL